MLISARQEKRSRMEKKHQKCVASEERKTKECQTDDRDHDAA